jgi:hypothetical protein
VSSILVNLGVHEHRGKLIPPLPPFEDQDVQFLLRHQGLQTGVLLLEFLDPAHRVTVHRTALGPPEVNGYLGHPSDLATSAIGVPLAMALSAWVGARFPETPIWES